MKSSEIELSIEYSLCICGKLVSLLRICTDYLDYDRISVFDFLARETNNFALNKRAVFNQIIFY